MPVPNPNIRFTYEDYKSLPESMSKRYELLDGDLIMVPAQTTSHQRVSRNLGFILVQFARASKAGEVFYAPVDVVFGEGKAREVVQPDLVLVSHARRHIVTEEEIRGAPDLAVEILSPGTEEGDRGYKKALYGRYGVKEYWIVDPTRAQTLEIYLPGEAGVELAAKYSRDAEFGSHSFPELRIDLKEVFEQQ